MHFRRDFEKNFGGWEIRLLRLGLWISVIKKKTGPFLEEEGQPLSLHRMRINRESPKKGARPLFLLLFIRPCYFFLILFDEEEREEEREEELRLEDRLTPLEEELLPLRDEDTFDEEAELLRDDTDLELERAEEADDLRDELRLTADDLDEGADDLLAFTDLAFPDPLLRREEERDEEELELLFRVEEL
jgi:hypothetical protein